MMLRWTKNQPLARSWTSSPAPLSTASNSLKKKDESLLLSIKKFLFCVALILILAALPSANNDDSRQLFLHHEILTLPQQQQQPPPPLYHLKGSGNNEKGGNGNIIRKDLSAEPQEINVESDMSNSHVSRKSHLFPNWQSILQQYKARGRNDEISFHLYDFHGMNGNEGPPPFYYPVQDALHSAEYIVDYEWNAMMGWMKALRKAQAEKSLQDSSATANCLDIGANGGFYSLMSRAAGCRTLAVDAQPRCLQRLSSAAALNEYSTDFDVLWTAVGEDTTQSISVGATKCSGVWAVVESDWINKESSETVNVSMTPLLQIVEDWIIDDTDAIDVFKIDVEGSEMAVLHSAVPLFQSQRIGEVFAEIAPGRALKITPLDTILETVEVIYKSNYRFETRSPNKVFDLQAARDLFVQGENNNDPKMFFISRISDAQVN